MNVLLLDEGDLLGPDRARIEDERVVDVRKVLGFAVGDSLVVGRVGGRLGRAEITELSREHLELRFELNEEPPPPSSIVLALALPRPPTLRKVLQQGTAMGVKRFVFFHAARVEKSYWQSKELAEQAIRRQLLLGLSQARDTILPTLDFHRRFLPFAQDELPSLPGPKLLADLRPESCSPERVAGPATLLLGPEGGWVDFEIETLMNVGARVVSLGPRALRVETAAVALLARLAT